MGARKLLVALAGTKRTKAYLNLTLIKTAHYVCTSLCLKSFTPSPVGPGLMFKSLRFCRMRHSLLLFLWLVNLLASPLFLFALKGQSHPSVDRQK